MLPSQSLRLVSEQVLLRPLAMDISQMLRQAPTRTFRTISKPTSRPGSTRPLRRPQCPNPRPRTALRRHQSTKPSSLAQSPDPTPHLGSPSASPSMTQRLRKMSREYGWTALGVYLALSALDFPFCVMAVRMLGTDRIGRWEHNIIRGFWSVVSVPFPGGEAQVREVFAGVAGSVGGALESVGLRRREEKEETVEVVDGAVAEKEWSWGVEEAQKENKENATWATQLALAYAVHKSFIFIRVPLTAAVLPRVVKTLRGWGWNIGKRTRKTTT